MTEILLQATYVISGAIVLAEALNKIERATPRAPGLSRNKRLTEVLKAAAWLLLALAAGGAIINPMMHLSSVELGDVCAMVGLAVLVVRARIQEVTEVEPRRVESDDFQRTQRIRAGKY